MKDFKPRATILAELNALKLTGGVLKDAKVVLCRNTWTDGETAPPQDFAALNPVTEGGYGGAESVTWSGATMRNGSEPVLPGQEIELVFSGTGDPAYINSYAFLNSAGDTLIAIRRLSTPVRLETAGDSVRVDVYYPYGK